MEMDCKRIKYYNITIRRNKMIAKKEKGEKIVTVLLFKKQNDKLKLIKAQTNQTTTHIVRAIIDAYKVAK